MPITLAQAKKLKNGQTVYTPGFYNADGTAQRWRVSGMPKVFKDPGRVRVPIKHGMYESWYIDETNLHGFSLKEPKPQTKTQRKKSAEERKKPRVARPYYPQYGKV
jgi:hypothetical protein